MAKFDKNCSNKDLDLACLNIRKQLLELSVVQNIHLGGDLSVTDLMTLLWQYQMEYDPCNPKWEKRDRFVLSKGHASEVMALNQAALGCFSFDEVIREYATDESRFSMHPCNLINPYIEISTGSLGHGMPVATGIAAALRIKKNFSSRVYTIMGDGEQSEGSIWEAVMNASMQKLGNLVAILDYNKAEADGFLQDMTGLGNIADKYREFNWLVYEINGHDVSEIRNCFDNLPNPSLSTPVLICAHTIKGWGVSYMENKIEWHTGQLSLEQANEAKERLENEFRKKYDSKNRQ